MLRLFILILECLGNVLIARRVGLNRANWRLAGRDQDRLCRDLGLIMVEASAYPSMA
jgi:hypothetical protein